MAMFRLWIKGDPDEALAAAARRNVQHPSIDAINKEFNQTVIMGHADELALQRWFIEHNYAPFPTGSLLFYQPAVQQTQ
jgi:hypothetical protein